MAGWSVQYATAAGTSWQVTALSGSIGPGRYYLIRQAAGAGGTQGLPTPDATGNVNLSATAGKVALVKHTTPLGAGCPPGDGIADMVGYGAGVSCFEGSGRAPTPGNNTAALRKDGGCADTDDNAADFQTGAPAPRNGDAPARLCAAAAQTDATRPGGGYFFLSGNELFGAPGAAGGGSFLRAALTSRRPPEGSTRWRTGVWASGPRGTRGGRPPPRGAWP